MTKRISIYQFFALMIIFQYGSVVLYFLAPDAKQDVWIGYIVYSIVGVILQMIYIYVYRRYPEDTIVTYLPKIYGKILGNIISILYILYFIYIAANIFREFMELIATTALRYTPKIMFGALSVIVIMYAAYYGIETIAGMAQFYIIILFIIKVLSLVLILLTPDTFDISNLKPVFENGVLNFLKNSWILMLVPYGETVVFTMIYPIINENSKIKKIASLAIVLEGIILAMNNILFISTLGVDFALNCNFPLLETYRIIDAEDLLIRMDIMFAITFIIDGLFKISIFMYVAMKGISQFFHVYNLKVISSILGCVLLAASFLISRNLPQQLNIGHNFVMKYIHLPMQVILPFITFSLCCIKSKSVRKI